MRLNEVVCGKRVALDGVTGTMLVQKGRDGEEVQDLK